MSPSPGPATLPDAHTAILLDFLETAMTLQDLAAAHRLSLPRLLAIVRSPAFLDTLRGMEEVLNLRISITQLSNAAHALGRVAAGDSLVEARRAATSLVRLATRPLRGDAPRSARSAREAAAKPPPTPALPLPTPLTATPLTPTPLAISLPLTPGIPQVMPTGPLDLPKRHPTPRRAAHLASASGVARASGP